MQPIRFVLLGGFLGAGKTTSIARLAKIYRDRGLRVGIVTNDQAADLVDTHTLRGEGFAVEEVAGACFCCSFDELTDQIDRLGSVERPDIVLAEPVGSCTDLVATVVLPIMGLFGDQYRVAPYGVLLKPSHGKKILSGAGGFSPQADYIFRKQLEEADFVAINRIDQLRDDEAEALEAQLRAACPDVPVLRISARTGENFDALVDLLDSTTARVGQRTPEIDYDTYAEGEAQLGWLNARFRIEAPEPFSLDELLMGVVEHLRRGLDEAGAETAHLKAIGLPDAAQADAAQADAAQADAAQADAAQGVANLVSRQSAAELSIPSRCRPLAADLVVNARVAADPELLEQRVAQAVQQIAQRLGASVQVGAHRSLRPGRPVPTHRYAAPAS